VRVRGKRLEARSKKQEARGKRRKEAGKRIEMSLLTDCFMFIFFFIVLILSH